ncbi:MAG: type II toxin-antitoxin system VapC family toxin [Anaerolineae bacterium]
MIRVVADTHALIWYLYNDPRLSPLAGSVMDAADAGGDQVALSSISLVEVLYLSEKGRIHPQALERILTELHKPGPILVEVPLDHVIVEAMRRVDRASVPDMPDRIIAATAVYLGIPLISKDSKIQISGLATIW